MVMETVLSKEQIDELVESCIDGLGKRIEHAMIAAGVRTNRHLARLMGVSHVAVGSWIKGQNKPDMATIYKMSLILGQKVSYFLGETPLNENPNPNFSDAGVPELVDGTDLKPLQDDLFLDSLFNSR